tara:strand:- start:885 stop:2045 length:1161 start_codon:yes stop_codon:yes gene_type:complete
MLCEVHISPEIDSQEHIIPNAIGGRKTTSGFLCAKCNASSGDTWEAALARQLNALSLIFRINRQRGKVPSQNFQTSGGKALTLNADGTLSIPRPIFRREEDKVGIKFDISARDMREARKMLRGLARKYSQLDIEECLQGAKNTSKYPDDPIIVDISFGGTEEGRSLVKSVVALLSANEVNPRHADLAIKFLTGDTDDPCYGFYYEKDLVKNRPEGVPFHCIHVTGCPENGLIRAYLEYFGVMRVVMCLSSTYAGDAFSATYSLDPTTGKELNLVIDLNLTSREIDDAYEGKKWSDAEIKDALVAVIHPAMVAQHELEKERVISEAVAYAFANSGAKEGDQLTDEQLNRLIGLLWEKIQPMLLRQISTNHHRRQATISKAKPEIKYQ